MSELEQLVKKVENTFGGSLPSRYLERINSLEQSAFVSHPKLPHQTWRFRTAHELVEGTQVDRYKGNGWETVSLFGKMLADVGITTLNGTGRKPKF